MLFHTERFFKSLLGFWEELEFQETAGEAHEKAAVQTPQKHKSCCRNDKTHCQIVKDQNQSGL